MPEVVWGIIGVFLHLQVITHHRRGRRGGAVGFSGWLSFLLVRASASVVGHGGDSALIVVQQARAVHSPRR